MSVGVDSCVFISYSRADRDFSVSFIREIEQLGGSVWFDDKIAPGDAYEDKLRQAIHESDAFILIVPKEGAHGANNVFFEAGAAKAMRKSIVMVLAGGGHRELPQELMNFMCLDARNRPVAEVAATLMRSLTPAMAS